MANLTVTSMSYKVRRWLELKEERLVFSLLRICRLIPVKPLRSVLRNLLYHGSYSMGKSSASHSILLSLHAYLELVHKSS